MGRRTGRKVTRRMKAAPEAPGVGSRRLVACGRISGGVSVTYVPLRLLPSTDEICTTAIRKVTRALKRG